jgi:hypothetical protein
MRPLVLAALILSPSACRTGMDKPDTLPDASAAPAWTADADRGGYGAPDSDNAISAWLR